MTATSLAPQHPGESLSFYKAQSCAEVVQAGVDKVVSQTLKVKETERHYTKNVRKLEYRRKSCKMDSLPCREVPNITIIPTSSSSIDNIIASHEPIEHTVDIYSRPNKLKRNNSVNLKIQEQQMLQKKRRASNNQLSTFTSHLHTTPQQQQLSSQQLSPSKQARRHSFITKKISQILRSSDQLQLFQESMSQPCKPPSIDCSPILNHAPNLPIIRIQITDDDDEASTPSTNSSNSSPLKNRFDLLGTEII